MADKRVNDHSYGQVGRAIYDQKAKKWGFGRQASIIDKLRQTGEIRTAIPPSSIQPFGGTSRPSGSFRSKIFSLSLEHPEVVAAIPLLPFAAYTSQVAASIAWQHDPAASTLFALGRATDLDNQRSGARTILIAAMVGGDTREEVRLIKIFKEPKAWTDQFPRTTLDVLSVGHEEGWWVGGGGSIWQICFSQQNRDVGPWMAVRQSRSTTIFRPLYKRIPVISTGSLHRKHPPSRMSPNPVVTISSAMTGGSSHADVTFNPWYARQVAVIDNNGRWSIWDVEGQEQKRHIWRLSPGPEGQIYDERVAESRETCQADGWGRICWAGDIHTLTVFNRRQMAIFDIRSVPSKPLSFPNLGLGRSSSWILDVKRSPTEDGHLFIVTSSEVIWMAVQNVTSLDDFGELTWRARILSSWRHFRAAEDTSLQLEVMAHHAGGVLTILYSRFSGLASAFHFYSELDKKRLPYSTSDPYEFPIMKAESSNQAKGLKEDANKHAQNILSISFRPLPYRHMMNEIPVDVGAKYKDEGVKFYQFFVFDSALGLQDMLFAQAKTRAVIEPVYSGAKHPRQGLQKSAAWAGDTTFMVNEALDWSEGGLDEETQAYPPRESQAKKAEAKSRKGLRGIDNRWLYKAAYDLEASAIAFRVKTLSASSKDQEEFFLALGEKLRVKIVNGYHPFDTLLEIYTPDLALTDLEDMSHVLQDILTSIDREQDLNPLVKCRTKVLAPQQLFGLRESEKNSNYIGLSLSNVYELLIQTWVGVLSHELPGRARLAKEKVVRAVAIELKLAAVGIGLEDIMPPLLSADGQEEASTTEASSREPPWLSQSPTDRPKRGSQASTRPPSPTGESRATSQGPHPTSTPSDPADPLSPTVSASTTSFQPQEDPAVARLRAYTTLNSQPQLPPSMTRVLAHWSLNKDPDSYSWEATRRACSNLSGDTDADDTETQTPETSESATKRARIRRRLERRLAQQRKEAAARPVPERKWGSQPDARAAQWLASSSQVGEELEGIGRGMGLPMSQVERGPFVGRKEERIRQKRRRQGF